MMKEKILAFTVVGLMVFGGIGSFGFYFVKAQSFSEEQVLYDATENEIFKEIAETVDKVLVVDKIIGDRYVKFWEHVIDGVFVKNDSILLHLDPETGDILKYEKSWTDVELGSLDFREDVLRPNNYFWKKIVVFPDEDDSGVFYSFYVPVGYPVVCWEVRYTDGTTIMYNLNGEQIGRGVQAPTVVGLALYGYGDLAWSQWMYNARDWYSGWCGRVNSMGSPDNWLISNFLKEPDCSYFYAIAHSGGLPTRFQSSGPGVYYTASQLHEDMKDRGPYKLAVLCCCSAMNDTGPGTLSYEFRKGEMTDTVTIGYDNMGECPYWLDSSIPWQDFMFKKMDQGYKMKKAFDLACAQYPGIADYVKFVGDENLRVKNNPPEVYIYVYGPYGNYIGPYTLFDPPTPNRKDLELNDGQVGKMYTFKATAPITHPSWPDTNDPQGGTIVAYQWERTGDDGGYNANSDETTSSSTPVTRENRQSSQGQSQNQGASPVGGLEGDFIEECEIEPIKWSWNEKGTYEVTLSVEGDEGTISSATIIIHITSSDNTDQNEEQNSQSNQQSTSPLFFQILQRLQQNIR